MGCREIPPGDNHNPGWFETTNASHIRTAAPYEVMYGADGDVYVDVYALDEPLFNFTDGANAVWPAASVARLRVEAFASWARWKFMGWDPGEAEIIDNIHWVTTDRENLSGASAFLELSHRTGMVRPYLYTGLSYYRGSWKDTENTDYGAAAGAGIDFDLAGWRFFAEGSVRLFGLTGRMTDDPQGVMPLTVGTRL